MDNREINELIYFCETTKDNLELWGGHLWNHKEEKFDKIQEILEHYKTCQYNNIFQFLENKIPILYHAFLISIGLALGIICYDALVSFIKGLF